MQYCSYMIKNLEFSKEEKYNQKLFQRSRFNTVIGRVPGEIYYFMAMENSDKDKFEDTLQDILTPNDPKGSSPASPQPSPNQPNKQTFKTTNRSLPIKIPHWAELLIRILAALCALAMLILFGLQVANR